MADVYQEIIQFLNTTPTYASVGKNTAEWVCQDIVDALRYGTYCLIRNECGELVLFCSWRRITAEDLPKLKRRGRTVHNEHGNILQVTQLANINGPRAMWMLIRALKKLPITHSVGRRNNSDELTIVTVTKRNGGAYGRSRIGSQSTD